MPTDDDFRAIALALPEAEPSYVGQHGWVGVRLARVDAEELRELVTEAWLMTAPKRLARQLED